MTAVNTFYRKVGDRLPPIEAILQGGDGDAVDLTGGGVKFLLRRRPGLAALIDAAAVIVDEASGSVRYDWSVGDATLPIGQYEAEFEFTDGTGRKATFPNTGYFRVVITGDIG